MFLFVSTHIDIHRSCYFPGYREISSRARYFKPSPPDTPVTWSWIWWQFPCSTTINPMNLLVFLLPIWYLCLGRSCGPNCTHQRAPGSQRSIDNYGAFYSHFWHVLFGMYQILPGPEATELCMFFRCLAGRRWGGLAMGLSFVLPGFMLMLATSYTYVIVGFGNTYFDVSFHVLQPMVAAMVRAFFSISGTNVQDLLWTDFACNAQDHGTHSCFTWNQEIQLLGEECLEANLIISWGIFDTPAALYTTTGGYATRLYQLHTSTSPSATKGYISGQSA